MSGFAHYAHREGAVVGRATARRRHRLPLFCRARAARLLSSARRAPLCGTRLLALLPHSARRARCHTGLHPGPDIPGAPGRLWAWFLLWAGCATFLLWWAAVRWAPGAGELVRGWLATGDALGWMLGQTVAR